jgi:Dolichyl-phosphate-mannose-protein mannosyltransferase
MQARGVGATILLFGAALAAAWAAIVLLSGGVIAGPLVSRDPLRPLIAAAILATLGRVLSAADFDAGVARLIGPRERWPARVAAVAAAAVFVVAIAWNTRAAGGSDSSCYLLQADAFAHGHAVLRHPLAGTLSGAPPAMFAPTGFIPSPRDPFAAVPICAPGLALVMAAFERSAGRGAAFLAVPLFAALTVCLTFALARRMDDDVSGTAAAILLALSPIFLYQAVQPMSDVPATALWLAALIGCVRGDRRGDIAAGICASFAVLTRPNLAVAVVPLAWLLRDRRAWIAFGVSALPALAALAALNGVRYGSPLASGYGEAGSLFSFAHVVANAPRYLRWLVETQSPLILYAVVAPFILWRRGHGQPLRKQRALALICSGAVILVVATYLAYSVFDDWWYLRFLLPVLPVLIGFMVVAGRRLFEGLPAGAWRSRRRPLLFIVFVMLVVWYGVVAAGRHVFDLQRLESRFVLAGEYAARELPSDAVVLAVQQSGSIRFYAGLPTIAWDAVPADGLDALIERLHSDGHPVFAVLEDAEAEPFRERFHGQPCGGLAERPFAEVFAAVRVRVYLLRCGTSPTTGSPRG